MTLRSDALNWVLPYGQTSSIIKHSISCTQSLIIFFSPPPQARKLQANVLFSAVALLPAAAGRDGLCPSSSPSVGDKGPGMGVSGLSERGRITQTHGWDRGDQTVLSLLYSPPELGLAALSLPPSPTPFSFQAGSGEGRGEGKKKT